MVSCICMQLRMVINETLRLCICCCRGWRLRTSRSAPAPTSCVCPWPCGCGSWIPVLSIHHDEAMGERTRTTTRVQAGPVRARVRGAVPAICIGQAYAMVETTVVLAMLLTSFRFGIFDTYAIVGNTGGSLRVRERKEAWCFLKTWHGHSI